MTNLDKVILIAKIAHRGQFRFDKVTPYFTHCEAVANSLSDNTEKIIGYLHDVLEDTIFTENDLLRQRISKENIKYLHILNKNNYNSYAEYLKEVKKYPITKDVKIADINHNMNDKPSKRQKQKYFNSLMFLKDEIDYDTLVKNLDDLYK